MAWSLNMINQASDNFVVEVAVGDTNVARSKNTGNQ
jgi:hypothetical protein